MYLSLERILFQFLALVNQIIQFILIKVFLSFICWGSLVDSLFCIIHISFLPCTGNYQVSLKKKVPSTNQTYLWHKCIRYINLNRNQRLVKSGILHLLAPKNLLIYKSFIEGKWSRGHLLLKGFESNNVWS